MEEKNYEKVQLFDVIENWDRNNIIYSDYFGLLREPLRFRIEKVRLKNGEELLPEELCVRRVERGNISYPTLNRYIDKSVIDIFSLKLWKKKEHYVYYDYYGKVIVHENGVEPQSYWRRSELPFSEDNVEKADVKEIELKVDSSGYSYTFTKKTINILNHEVRKVPYDYRTREVNLALLQVGDLIYWRGGTFKINEIYQPNKERKLFKTENLCSGSVEEITGDNSSDIYEVPYIKYHYELEQFDDMLNENALSPKVVYRDNTYNIYWLPVEDACQYTVSLYKQIDKDFYGRTYYKLYHLQDFCVDRNTCYLVLDKLIGGRYILRITAENRNGEVVAKSRGIDGQGEPRFWK